MTNSSATVERRLAEEFFARRPGEAAQRLEAFSAAEAAEVIEGIGSARASEAFRRLSPAVALGVLEQSSASSAQELLHFLDPPQAGALLSGLDQARRDAVLAAMSESEARQLRELMEYPPDSAGRSMDPRIAVFAPHTPVSEALARLRGMPQNRKLLNVWVVDSSGRLAGSVSLQDAALAPPGTLLSQLQIAQPIAVSAVTSREEVTEIIERHRLPSLPVVDFDNRPIGVLRLSELVSAVGAEHAADLVSMTGASRDERALSPVSFAVRKRLPWLQINLATAFLAASVVGLFEDTIAQFTALAVLLPVVAGQSGNTGAQALAVVLRGLALREITLRHWPRVAIKEFLAGLSNGLAVSAVTCIGVYVWSGSAGLVLVIGIAMVFSMAIAGVAGAIIPVVLSALGQDPAQSSSIVLTTVTDVFGFFSFLGLAALLSSML